MLRWPCAKSLPSATSNRRIVYSASEWFQLRLSVTPILSRDRTAGARPASLRSSGATTTSAAIIARVPVRVLDGELRLADSPHPRRRHGPHPHGLALLEERV